MAAPDTIATHDPYRRCEGSCTHDLARGVLVSDLLADEGPFPDSHPLLSLRPLRSQPAQRDVVMPAAS